MKKEKLEIVEEERLYSVYFSTRVCNKKDVIVQTTGIEPKKSKRLAISTRNS